MFASSRDGMQGILRPMSQANVELVRAMLDAWNEGGPDDLVAFMADEHEWHEVDGRPEAAGPPTRRGRDAMHSSLSALFDAWESYRLEPEEVRDVDDDRVVAVVREAARGRTSGLEVESRWGYLITIREGLITRVEAYRDADRALEAAETATKEGA
jgi:ketosteroid isomerase-like protein